MNKTVSHYEIRQGRDSIVVAKPKTRNGGRRARDQRDTAYGACVHSLHEVYTDGTSRFAI